MTNDVVVTQADRQAAYEYLTAVCDHAEADEARNGRRDRKPLVQAFASHRIEALAAREGGGVKLAARALDLDAQIKLADRAAYDEMRRQGFSGGWDNEALVRVIVAALAERPVVDKRAEAIEQALCAIVSATGVGRHGSPVNTRSSYGNYPAKFYYQALNALNRDREG